MMRRMILRPNGIHRRAVALCLMLLWLAACHGVRQTDPVSDVSQGLTPSQVYAGEVLAYMMEVVTGTSGNPDKREKWQTRGLGESLDLDQIRFIMSDPEQDKSRLMVYDTDIIGLSRVVYRYDPLLNQFKGRQPVPSLYPADELVALRLLLVGKLNRKEVVDFPALMERIPSITTSGYTPAANDAAATGLHPDELRLLHEVFRSEPVLASYLAQPALIASLERMGIIDASATKTAADPKPPVSSGKTPLVTVSVIPSIQPLFDPDPATGSLQPTDKYRRLEEKVIEEMMEASSEIARDMFHRMFAGRDKPPWDWWTGNWQPFMAQHLHIAYIDRPMTIHPGNAQEMVDAMAPESDLNIIILGKHVSRSMDIVPYRDTYPYTTQIYLDSADIAYGMVDESLAVAGDLIARRLIGRFVEEHPNPPVREQRPTIDE